MKDQVTCLIIEDVESCANYLSEILNKNFKNIRLLGLAKDVETSIDSINRYRPDLIFMDIEIAGGTAFDVLRAVDMLHCEVIFTTSHGNYIEKAMEHFAFYFLLKPVDEQKLIEVINAYFRKKENMFSLKKYEKFQQFFHDQQAKLLIDVGQEYVTVELDNVIKCQADASYTIFQMEGKKNYLASNILKYYDELLNNKGFFRANRSTLINIGKVKCIKKDKTIIMNDGSEIMVSARNKPNLNSLITQLS